LPSRRFLEIRLEVAFVSNAIRADGSRKWAFTIDRSVGAPSVAGDGTVYYPTNSNLDAVDPGGSKKWTFEVENPVGQPAVAADGTIYATAQDLLCALNPNDTLKWNLAISYPTRFAPAIGRDGTVYVGTVTGSFMPYS
jgi:hypothetical protein